MTPLTLGYTPCPNDTFVFTSWVKGLVPDSPAVTLQLEDIDTLNRMAENAALDVVKVSFHVFGFLRDEYCLLRSGGALGRGCGPLVVAREGVTAESLKGKRVAIPGKRTTAALLLRLFNASVTDLVVMPFDKILQATADGTVDAGLIIHESRFTYQRHGLHQVVDLGEWWEESTGHAIPLGGILARRSLGAARIAAIDRALKASVERAYSNPADIWDTVRAHAQEMDDDVMRRHIDLYVNEFTLDYGDEGEDAIRYLFNAAEELGIIPRSDRTLFIDR